ncbi:MAG: glucose-6-phosphate isomerase [Desulfuromonadales bacterium]|nr:glucose-6-phosphate isomerase [Desulfuromonadales bacterium]
MLELDYDNMLATAVGEEYGIAPTELAALMPRCARIHADLMARHAAGELPFYDLPTDRAMLTTVQKLADELRGRFENVVVLGIGGSALGTTAAFRALGALHHNLLPRKKRGGAPRLFVQDNVDPAGFGATLELLEPHETLFLVISKSGATVETGSQFAIARHWVEERQGDAWQDHFVLITDPEQGALRRLANDSGMRSCAIPSGVGGRFTVFTPVALLPLALAGVDIAALLAGAAEFMTRAMDADLLANPAYLNGALQYLAYQKGLRISVMMPYSDRLRDVADWYRQLWAESLGKRMSLDGEDIFVGPTPVKALGATDQHSQVQLYMEGPCDKTVTFIAPRDYGVKVPIPAFAQLPELAYLTGRGMDELLRCEQQATAQALTRNHRPNCTIWLSEVSPRTVGALFYLFEVQTLFAGALFNVNPLDQPGVELGKQLTKKLLLHGAADAATGSSD